MRSLLKVLFVLFFACLMSQVSLAEDHGGGHEAPPEGEHGGGGEGHAEPKKVEAAPGWIEIEAQISSLEAKLQAKTRAIEGLIEEKNHLRVNDPQLAHVVTEIGKEDRERRKIAEDLEKHKTILHFRFPERGAAKNRKYEKVDIKSVDEIESSMSVDGRLNRSLKRMRGQYGSEESQKINSTAPIQKQIPKQEGTIIMQK
jgi:hypothetical protein